MFPDFKQKPECPHLVKKNTGYYFCELTERPSGRIQTCPREYGGECYDNTYTEILKEWEGENDR